MTPIYFFSKNDPFYELSNFYPQGLEEDGVYWRTVEHYFQAQKFVGHEFAGHRAAINRATTPKQAKSLGQSRAIPLRPDWEQVKEEVMLHALRKKFAHPTLRTVLLGTGSRELIEGSPTDHYWGCGADGSGQNRLGVLLVMVRDEFRTAGQNGVGADENGGPTA